MASISPPPRRETPAIMASGLFVMRTLDERASTLSEASGDDLRLLRREAEMALGTVSAEGHQVHHVIVIHPHGTSDALSCGDLCWDVGAGVGADRPDPGLVALELTAAVPGQGAVRTATS